MTTPVANASPPPEAGASATPPSGRPHRRWLVPALAVVVVVAVVLAGLVALGVIPLFRSGTSSTPFAPTFLGAAGEGQSTANSAGPGTWSAAVGSATRLPYSETVLTGNLTGYLAPVDSATGCNITLAPHLPSRVVVQGTPASAGPGDSAFWVVVYVNGSGGAVGVSVNGGNVSELFTMTGNATCRSDLNDLAAYPGGPDSPAVVAAVNQSGGSRFLAAHPGSIELFFALSAVFLQPIWAVIYTTCAISPVPGSSGFDYNATLSGLTVTRNSTGPVSCSLPTIPSLRPGAPDLGGTGRAVASPALGKAI